MVAFFLKKRHSNDIIDGALPIKFHNIQYKIYDAAIIELYFLFIITFVIQEYIRFASNHYN